MRVSVMLTSAALVLAACGGDKTDETEGTPPAPPEAPAAAGTTHEIQMVMEGTEYKYVPANLTIKSGDVVVFKAVSGAGHDVRFWADSIPAGAATALSAGIADKADQLATIIVGDGAQTTVSFAGAAAGEYKFYCMPHMAMNMVGKITVTP